MGAGKSMGDPTNPWGQRSFRGAPSPGPAAKPAKGSPPGHIKLTVENGADSTPIRSARAELSGPSKSTASTDAAGVAGFHGLGPGAYTLDVSAEGFEGNAANVNVQAGKTAQVTVALRKPIYLVAGMDGTDSSDWMRNDGRNSHVYRFVHDLVTTTDDDKMHVHGPGLLGGKMSEIIKVVSEWVVGRMDAIMSETACRQEDIRVCLVGHSRGCVAAICVANALRQGGLLIANRPKLKPPIAVHFMGLYDAVDRAPIPSPDTVLSNVAHCYYARRQKISTNPARGSRGTFGQVEVARTDRPGGHQMHFDTSHGGVGGDPGFFQSLTGISDHYCNTLTLVKTREELAKEYGYARHGGSENIELDEPVPLYVPLEGTERLQRIAAIKHFLSESGAADAYIRAGAMQEGLRFRSKPTKHLPYGSNDETETLWKKRLEPLVGPYPPKS